MSDATVVIVGWPRWTRETIVRQHPLCQRLGIEQVVTDASPDDVDGTVYTCLQRDATSPAPLDEEEEEQARGRMQWCLGQISNDVRTIVLRDGIDLNGVIHHREEVRLSGMPLMLVRSPGDDDSVSSAATGEGKEEGGREGGEEGNEEGNRVDRGIGGDAEDGPPSCAAESTAEPSRVPLRHAIRCVLDTVTEDVATKQLRRSFRAWMTAHRVDDEPPWLTRAGTLTHSDLPEPTTRLRTNDGVVVLTLIGILPPELLRALSRAVVPTIEGDAVPIVRSGASVVHVGRFAVDPSSWNAQAHTYTCTPSRTGDPTAGLAPTRNALANIRTIHKRRAAEINRR